MHEYRKGNISRLMLKINQGVADIDLCVATKMLEICGIEPVLGGGAFAGRSLVLGVGLSPFACALGSRDFGHEVVGICFHASSVHQQNFFRNSLRSRARFTYSTTRDLLLAMPVFTWDFVFVLPYVNWSAISDFVLNRMQNATIVVAQKMPIAMELENLEHEFIRTTSAGYCHSATAEEGEWVIFKIR